LEVVVLALFLLLFFIVLAVYLAQVPDEATTVIVNSEESTIGLNFTANVYCLTATPDGMNMGGSCTVIVQYNQGSTVINPQNQQTIYKPHPCQKYGKTAVLQPDAVGVQVRLCNSWGLNDGVFITSTPNLTKGSLWDNEVYYDIPQDVNALYLLEVELTNNNTQRQWEFEPLNIGLNPSSNGSGNSLAQLRLAAKSTTISSKTTEGEASIGTIGGSAFFLWLMCRLLADIHARATKPYAGNLEHKRPPQSPPS